LNGSLVYFNQIIRRFYFNDKYKLNLIFALSFFAGLFEYFGLVLIYQFILVLSNPNAELSIKIVNFFQAFFSITDSATAIFALGLAVAGIYIFKNIYMLFFQKINNFFLADLSVKIISKIINRFLLFDAKYINDIDIKEKNNLIAKVQLIVWEYCSRYINLVINIVIAILLLIYLFVKFTKIALISTIFISFLFGFEYLFLKIRSSYLSENYTKKFNKLHGLFVLVSKLTKEIKLANLENEFIKKTEKAIVDYSKLESNKSFNSVFHVYFTEISIMFVFLIVLTVVFFFSSFNNQYLITTLATICIIALRLAPIVNRIQSCLYLINSNKGLVEELINFDSRYDESEPIVLTKEKLDFKNKIELKGVEFSYSDKKEKFKCDNLIINKGEYIGIVGKSGNFKTTLVLLICGFLSDENGKILIDNVELGKNNLKKWQNNISFLNQDYSAIYDDVYESVALSKEYEKEKIDNLFKILSLDELISQNKKIFNLSNGQKQRLALANVLYQEKDVLILDESTSNIDVFSEDKINDILLDLKGKKTIISIAHRLHSLKNADKIIYIDNGQIVDFDTIQNLKDKYSNFQKMFDLSGMN